jgi:uncharacterized protein (DUF305 family)
MKKQKLSFIKSLLLCGVIVIFYSCNKGDNHDHDHNDSSHSHTEGEHGHQVNTDSMGSGNDIMTGMDVMMKNMMQVPMTGDADYDFAKMMTEHHKGAITMAQAEISNGKDDKMKTMAQNIITMQNQEIMNMEEFTSKHEAPKTNSTPDNPFTKKMKASMDKMMSKMKEMSMTGDSDKDFATMMVVHHQSAVDMASAEIEYGDHAEIKVMAKKMITDQMKEIKEFNEWINSHK